MTPWKYLPGKAVGFYVLILLLALPVLGAQLYAADLWKALYSGRYLTTFHQFPHHSTFTFSPVRGFLTRNAFNWLGNLLFHGWYNLFGLVGFQGLRILCALTALVTVHSFARFRRSTTVLLVLLAFVYGIHQKLTVRTALFAVPLTPLLLFAWDRTRRNPAWLWSLPVLFLFWSNVHGSYVVGLGLLALLVGGRIVDQLRGTAFENAPDVRRTILCCLVVLATVVLVKPFPDTTGPERVGNATTRLATTLAGAAENEGARTTTARGRFDPSGILFPDRPWRSMEFESPFANTELLFFWIGLLTAVGAPIVLLLSRKRPFLSDWLVLTGATLLGLLYLRSVAYLPLVGCPLVLRHLPERSPTLRNPGRNLLLGTVLVSVLAGVIGSYVLTGSVNRLVGFREQRLGTGPIRKFSDELPEHLLANHSNERFFNTYGIGGFLIWKWWPRKRVFIDSKSSAYTTAFRRNHATRPVNELLDTYDLHHAILHRTSNWNERFFLKDSRWETIGMDPGTIAYRRQAVGAEP